MSDALFAQAVAARFGIAPEEAASRMVASNERASRNPRGMNRPVPTMAEVAESAWEATPLRRGHRAPLSDGAVCLHNAERRPVAGLLERGAPGSAGGVHAPEAFGVQPVGVGSPAHPGHASQ